MPNTSQPPWIGHPWLRRLAWIGVLLAGVASYLVLLLVVVITHYPNFIPALLLAGAVTPPTAMLVYAEGGAQTLPVSLWAVIFTAIFGGLLGFILAGLGEHAAEAELGSVPMALVAVIEETTKLILPVMLFLCWRPRDPRGGVVIGIAAGMGFGTLETLGYGFQALQHGQGLARLDATLLLRGLISPASHIAWTGMNAAMLWRIGSSRRRGWAVFGFFVTFAVSVVLHAVWDSVSMVPVGVAVAAFGFAVVMVFTQLSHRRTDGGRRPVGYAASSRRAMP